ncbi:SDR family oxidoreductase [Goodfellowiella coeruleoviolacea]|uniref:Uncharacterized conserved protein YbjT, contains NAD(P)-binding and DUF2867 domains n=1 Tax=Goodfellowiella coeruleoviolacea TaxID=334858 RepID=A0AAE3GIF1_9PSEU|nr:SDR family oxidoreductase [Goodfellowiella coeruleoviolacea]MCP2166738.1 Uncharacterized conserved protein YbjT, contains NAD(P)-binding and DUF2867 domains [Goodfellowiella coeruleoviolacea]
MILVTGATGAIGQHLVAQLKRDGVPFRALVRDEAKGRALGCDFVVGDFDDPDSITPALHGVDRLLLNTPFALPVNGELPMIRWQNTLIDAASAAGVRRIVKVSVWRARAEGKLGENAHWRIEQHLKASGVPWTVLRPNAFMQNFITGAAGGAIVDGTIVNCYGDGRLAYVDCVDIAACAAEVLTSDRGVGQSYDLTGPEALTQAEIAAKLSAALGRTVRYVGVPPAEMADTLTRNGFPAEVAREVTALMAEATTGVMAITTTGVRDLIGREPRTFDEFLASNRDAFDIR